MITVLLLVNHQLLRGCLPLSGNWRTSLCMALEIAGWWIGCSLLEAFGTCWCDSLEMAG
jgi:hypothetical protein